MLDSFKNLLFFPVANYFAFFAKIRLWIWRPRIIAITGSSGKTTLFHLVENQLGNEAHYSHHSNSALGIPFDILNLHRKTFKNKEWVSLFFKTPFQIFKKPFKEKLYVVECDADRIGEGRFLAKLLKPEVTLWISTDRTHSRNFEKEVPGKFKTVEEAIAYEFGYFLQYSSKLAILNKESKLQNTQEKRTKAKIEKVSLENLTTYRVEEGGTEFVSKNKYNFKELLPKEVFYSIEMCRILCEYLELKFDSSFGRMKFPPGRNSIFKGIKNTTLIDSTYNANLLSMKAILNMFDQINSKNKWLVLGDMLEQGSFEKEEHEKLAHLIFNLSNIKQVILLGKCMREYTYPILLKTLGEKNVHIMQTPKEVLNFLKDNLVGKETILFKASQYFLLETVIENLLYNKKDITLLPRREAHWKEKRKKWGF